MWGISILAAFRPLGYKLSCCGILWYKIRSDLLSYLYILTLNVIGSDFLQKKKIKSM